MDAEHRKHEEHAAERVRVRQQAGHTERFETEPARMPAPLVMVPQQGSDQLHPFRMGISQLVDLPLVVPGARPGKGSPLVSQGQQRAPQVDLQRAHGPAQRGGEQQGGPQLVRRTSPRNLRRQRQSCDP